MCYLVLLQIHVFSLRTCVLCVKGAAPMTLTTENLHPWYSIFFLKGRPLNGKNQLPESDFFSLFLGLDTLGSFPPFLHTRQLWCYLV